MKAKLLSKSLVLLAVFALVGCGKPAGDSESVESTPSEEESTVLPTAVSTAISWDDASGAPTLDGQFIRLQDVTINATYSNTRLCVQQVEGNQVIAIEVVTAADYTATFDVKDTIDVYGTVSSEDGRPQIINAELQWGTGGQEACDGTGPINYYADFTRGAWDYNIKRSWAGRYTESTWQVATVPTVVPGEETVFYVAFPGEDLDVTDVENYSYLDVIIPALNEEQAAVVSEWASTLEVGCGVYLFSQVWFRDYICIMLPYTSFRFSGTNAVVELTGIFDNFADVEEAIQDTITLDLPTITSEHPFSWVLDATSYTTEIEEGNPETEVPVIIVTANVKVANCEAALFDILGVEYDEDTQTSYIGAHEAEGWYCVESGQLSSGEVAYVFVNGDLQETAESTPEAPKYEVVNTTAQMMVYASLSENAIFMEIVPLTLDIVVVPEELSEAEALISAIAEMMFDDATAYNVAGPGQWFVAGLYQGENTEESLLGWCETAAAAFIPETYVEYAAPAMSQFQDGTPAAVAIYLNADGTVMVQISAYYNAEAGGVVVQVVVADLTA